MLMTIFKANISENHCQNRRKSCENATDMNNLTLLLTKAAINLVQPIKVENCRRQIRGIFAEEENNVKLHLTINIHSFSNY